MARTYASASEFTGSYWCPEFGAPEGRALSRLLVKASSDVERLTANAVYDVDDDGMPTDSKVAAAFRDAVCAQVAFTHETGDASGAAVGSGSMSIGSLSLGGKRANSNDVNAVQNVLIAPETVDILRNANLLTGIVSETW